LFDAGPVLKVAKGGTGISSFGTGVATFLGTPSSANLAAALTDETGSGANVFATSPTLVTPILGTPTSATLTNATGLPISTGVSGLGTGIATALAVNTGSAGAPVLFNGALGTPSSGTVTNLTGTASININGTVGATTASTGAFTTLSATGNVTLGDASTDTLNVGNGGLIKDASNNLGLGVTPAAWRSSEKALQVGAYTCLYTDSNVSTELGYNVYLASATGQTYLNTNFATRYQQYLGQHIWFNAPSGTAGNTISFTQAMTLDTDGDLGIGTTSPAAKLHIGGNNGIRFGDGASAKADITYTSAGSEFLDIKIQGTTGGYGNIRFSTGGTPSEAARIDASGNVGIGTSSPSYKLDVEGNFRQSNFNSGSLNGYFGCANTGSITLNFGGTTTPAKGRIFYSDNSDLFAFYTNSTERARIDSSGNLLVGTTSNLGPSGAAKRLVVSETSGGGALAAFISGYTGGAQTHVEIKTNYNGSDGIGFYNAASTIVGSITINSASTAYNTSSDYRLKENIAPMSGALAIIAQLKPCTYTWKVDGASGQGFIAHELAEVVPQCVTGEKDAVDENGNPKHQGIDTSFLVATLTAAIQELKADFDAYKASHP
jgi:hypothetical protein